MAEEFTAKFKVDISELKKAMQDAKRAVAVANSELMKTMKDITFKKAVDNDTKRENANIDGDSPMGTMLKYGSETAKEFYLSQVIDPKFSKEDINEVLTTYLNEFFDENDDKDTWFNKVKDVAEKGVGAVVCHKQVECSVPVIYVEDTKKALLQFASYYRCSIEDLLVVFKSDNSPTFSISGIKYNAFSSTLPFPNSLSYCVCVNLFIFKVDTFSVINRVTAKSVPSHIKEVNS